MLRCCDFTYHIANIRRHFESSNQLQSQIARIAKICRRHCTAIDQQCGCEELDNFHHDANRSDKKLCAIKSRYEIIGSVPVLGSFRITRTDFVRFGEMRVNNRSPSSYYHIVDALFVPDITQLKMALSRIITNFLNDCKRSKDKCLKFSII